MAAVLPLVRLAPEEVDDEVVVSKRKLDDLLREKDQENARLREKIRKQEKEIEDLRRQLTVHLNPNVPPSVRHHAPGYARSRPRVPPNERKRPGGRPGHEGVTREPLVPDRSIGLIAHACTKCHGRRLKRRGIEHEQEVEVVRQRIVTDYAVGVYDCLDCGETVRARLPNGRDPSGYGPQLQTDIVLGKIEERLPYRKLAAQLERDGVPVCPATLQGVVWGASERLGGTYDDILERIRRALVVYADETSLYVGGERWWLWTFTTLEDVLFVLRPSRGENVVREVLGEGFEGKVVVCDGWKAYPKGHWLLQRCWAHLLRVAKEGAEESRRGKELYQALCAAYHRLTKDLDHASARARARRLAWGERRLAELIAGFRKSWARGVRKVVTYLENGRIAWLTFLRHPGVEPTNNRAERSIREAVVIRKIIGTLRNAKGAEALTRLLSVLGTWKLRGDSPSANLYAALS